MFRGHRYIRTWWCIGFNKSLSSFTLCPHSYTKCTLPSIFCCFLILFFSTQGQTSHPLVSLTLLFPTLKPHLWSISDILSPPSLLSFWPSHLTPAMYETYVTRGHESSSRLHPSGSPLPFEDALLMFRPATWPGLHFKTYTFTISNNERLASLFPSLILSLPTSYSQFFLVHLTLRFFTYTSPPFHLFSVYSLYFPASVSDLCIFCLSRLPHLCTSLSTLFIISTK